MSPDLVYASLTEYQKRWLRGCRLEVVGLGEGVWQVTVVRGKYRGKEVIMRDIFWGEMDDADTHGRKLGYRAALAYGGANG